jgi:arylsulfatase A-like enzyme
MAAISRRAFLRAAGAAGALTLAAGAGAAFARPLPESAVAAPPNVILITLDTLRADHLSAYGYTSASTPALDTFARQGTRFDLHTVQQPQTNASHASMFTGMYPASSGVRVQMADRVPPSLDTLATLFAGAGFATAAVYSWLSLDDQFCGFQRGFESYENVAGKAPPGMDPPVLELLESTAKGRADRTTDAAIARITSMAKGPFFLWAHYFDAHYPYQPPGFDDGYRGPVDSSVPVIQEIDKGDLVPAEPDVAHLRALYDGEIAFLDQNLGRLFAALDRLDLSPRTVVAITGDHGESFGEHRDLSAGADFFHPHTLYNSEVRTPLLLRYPARVRAGSAIQAPTQAIDLLPTLLQLAGLPVPGQAQGKSLVTLLDGSDSGATRLAFSSMPDYLFTSVTTLGWKYIQNNTNASRALFDLRADPGELHDVSAAHPTLLGQMAGWAEGWMKREKMV